MCIRKYCWAFYTKRVSQTPNQTSQITKNWYIIMLDSGSCSKLHIKYTTLKDTDKSQPETQSITSAICSELTKKTDLESNEWAEWTPHPKISVWMFYLGNSSCGRKTRERSKWTNRQMSPKVEHKQRGCERFYCSHWFPSIKDGLTYQQKPVDRHTLVWLWYDISFSVDRGTNVKVQTFSSWLIS